MTKDEREIRVTSIRWWTRKEQIEHGIFHHVRVVRIEYNEDQVYALMVDLFADAWIDKAIDEVDDYLFAEAWKSILEMEALRNAESDGTPTED